MSAFTSCRTVTLFPNNSATATAQRLQWSIDGTTWSNTNSVVLGPSVTSTTVTGLNADTIYYFRVRASKDGGAVTSAWLHTAFKFKVQSKKHFAL